MSNERSFHFHSGRRIAEDDFVACQSHGGFTKFAWTVAPKYHHSAQGSAGISIATAQVYWVDDRRFCRPPASWRILYRTGDRWEPVKAQAPLGAGKDRFNDVVFDPVTAMAIRLEVEPQEISYRAGDIGPPDAFFLSKDMIWRECGIIEWRIR